MSVEHFSLVPVLQRCGNYIKRRFELLSKKADDLELTASCMPSKHPHLTQQELTEFREIFNLVRCRCRFESPHRY